MRLQDCLAAVLAQRVELPFYLTTILPFKFNENTRTQTVDIIICGIKIEEKCITLATLYTPSNDDPIFFQDFFDHLLDFQCVDVIISGNFNLVLDLEKDKKGGRAKTHTNT